jgi:hypothetical protein
MRVREASGDLPYAAAIVHPLPRGVMSVVEGSGDQLQASARLSWEHQDEDVIKQFILMRRLAA